MSPVITPLITLQQQLRIFHWQTTEFSLHKALGKTYEVLDKLIDEFVEVFIGKYGRPKAKTIFHLELQNLENSNLIEFIDLYIKKLISYSTEFSVQDTDLLNIRDEMLVALNRLKYLATLK
jgi:DNA-binding ferritin-like protein